MFNYFKVGSNKISFGGYIPVTVIGYAERMDFNIVVWRTPPTQEHLQFTKGIAPDGKHAIPGLVWVFGDGLDLYAYKEWDGEKTELYWAPFYNITRERVCLGTASNYIDDKTFMTFKDVMTTVQHSFFNSKFTHAGSEANVLKSFAGMYEKTLNQKQFPQEYLAPANLTVADVCDQIFKAEK